MKVRKFNESISKKVDKEYLEEIFQSFKDDFWEVATIDMFIVNDDKDNLYDAVNDMVNLNRPIKKISKIINLYLSRDYDVYDNILSSVNAYDVATNFYADLRSKLQILEQDGVLFNVDKLKESEIDIHIYTNDEAMSIQNFKKIVSLSREGLVALDLIDNNTVSIGISRDNSKKFNKLYKARMGGGSKRGIDKDFEKWFDKNFKMETIPSPEGDGDYDVLRIL